MTLIFLYGDDAPKARAKLASAGAVYQGELSIGRSKWLLADGFALDVREDIESLISLGQLEMQSDSHQPPLVD